MPTRDQAGQVSLLIIGMAVVLAMAVAVVVDASAAYLQRQGLDTIADGAALRGADLAATGEETYRQGVPVGRLDVTAAAARSAVRSYLVDIGAQQRYPGLTWTVAVDPATATVTVRLRAPLDLPLSVPGGPEAASIGASGAAVVQTGS